MVGRKPPTEEEIALSSTPILFQMFLVRVPLDAQVSSTRYAKSTRSGRSGSSEEVEIQWTTGGRQTKDDNNNSGKPFYKSYQGSPRKVVLVNLVVNPVPRKGRKEEERC